MAAPLVTENKTVEAVHPHSLLSPEQLKRIAFENGTVCRVMGFPSFITESILKSKLCYGRLKGLSHIKVQRVGKEQKPTAYITFDNEVSAQQAINFSNNAMLDDDGGTRLRASTAWNRYCTKFIQKKKCRYSGCPHRHKWGSLADVVNPRSRKPINIKQPAGFVLNIADLKDDMMSFSASDDLFTQIKKQIEFYFSVENMNNDDYLRRAMNDEGWIDIDVILKCNRMQQLKATKQKIREIAEISKDFEYAQDKDAVRMICWKAYIPCGQLQAKYDELQRQFESIRKYNAQIQRDYSRLDEKYNQLLNQQRFTEDKLKKVQNENEELKKIRHNELLLQNDDNQRKDYRLWTAKDIVHWIVNLNELRYMEYEESLMYNLVKEEIDGSCLKDLDKNDLHRFGITKFKDKRDIYENIHQLSAPVAEEPEATEYTQKEGMNDHQTGLLY